MPQDFRPAPAAPVSVLEKVLAEEQIAVFFQPVVNVRGRSILGFEAFSRSVSGEGARLDALDLFAQPWEASLRLRLCRLCRRKALEAFRPIAQRHQQMMLFLNVDAQGVAAAEKPGHLSAICETIGLAGRRVAIELERTGLGSPEIARFVQFYRAQGFKLSIDAMDGLSAPTEEIFALKPDYIKIDRVAYTDTAGKEFKRDMVAALCRLAERTGSTVVAKNVESEEEAVRLLDWGVNLQQGYFYTKDKDSQEKDPIRAFLVKVEEVNRRFREHSQAEVGEKRRRFEDYHKTLRKVAAKMGESIAQDFAGVAERIAQAEESLLCAYVLSEDGVQLTPCAFKKSLAAETPLLGPGGGKGEDLSIREDVLHLKSGFDKFVSAPFISAHARVPARTISTRFYNRENQPFILCLEFLGE
ncbi:MAG: EAL domain-containing protein [Proteobacteria bacterium]|nr:EAL domain-containing protein [Pseudomonadota bacterium]MBU1595631.1 EAL domain-containing protein [Pseudomonadota bacterium]